MIAQGDFHFLDPGVMPAQMLADLFVLFGAVGFSTLHLDDQLVNRFFQGNHTIIKLVQKKTDYRYCNDLDDIKDILKDKFGFFHTRKKELVDLLMNSSLEPALAGPT